MIDTLSDLARTAAGVLFAGPIAAVHFAMINNRPTAQCQQALDELVAAGLVSEEHPPSGGVLYRAVNINRASLMWLLESDRVVPFTTSEPIPGVVSEMEP